VIFRGQEITKEQLEQGVRLADALLAMAKVQFPDHQYAVAYGLGAFAEMALQYRSREEILAAITDILDVIETAGPQARRLLRGPELELIK
jgi:hypothetical protein